MRLTAVILFCASAAFAAGGAENAIIVVNADSWASLSVANEYAAARGIAPGHMVLLRDVPSFERAGVSVFREKILGPVLRTLDERGLAPQTDYILYAPDFPTAIDVAEDMKGQEFPKVITPQAAINSLTYFFSYTMGKNPGYLGFNTNFYYRQRALVAPEAPWPREEQARYLAALVELQKVTKARVKGADAARLAEEEKVLKAVRETFLALKAAHPKSTELLYNTACVHAQLGEGDAAIAALRAAIGAGWWEMRHAQQDPDLVSVRGRADFKELIEGAKNVKFDLMPTSGFRSSVGWLPNGALVPAEKGMRFMLSTVLAQTSGRGLSVREATENLRRSASADGTRPKGTVYFLENEDVRSTTREWGFRLAAEKLRGLGVAAGVEQGVLPKGKADVAGACIGASDFDWAKSGSVILPGAIVEHLTSFGGALEAGAGQTPLTALLRAGAAGASGTVTEPYAIQAKFPTPFVQWHYAQGCTLAEAFYQSIAGPYQLLIVGDALCAPWKKRLDVTCGGLEPLKRVSGKIKLVPRATSPDGLTPVVAELYIDGLRVATAKPGATIEVDTTKLADGMHDFSVAVSAGDSVGTRGSMSEMLSVGNAGREIFVTLPRGPVPWDRGIECQADAPGAKEIVLKHLGHEIARIDGAKGVLKADARLTGTGRVLLEAAAKFPDGSEARSIPMEIVVSAPEPLPARELAAGMTLAKGFHVTPAGGAAMVVEKIGGDWLTKAGVAKDGAFSVEGWVNVAETDVYQLQLHGPRELRITIDGHALDWPRGKEWWFVPVHLAKGAHLVRIEGRAEGTPRLDVRFGAKGTQPLDGAHLQHAVAR